MDRKLTYTESGMCLGHWLEGDAAKAFKRYRVVGDCIRVPDIDTLGFEWLRNSDGTSCMWTPETFRRAFGKNLSEMVEKARKAAQAKPKRVKPRKKKKDKPGIETASEPIDWDSYWEDFEPAPQQPGQGCGPAGCGKESHELERGVISCQRWCEGLSRRRLRRA